MCLYYVYIDYINISEVISKMAENKSVLVDYDVVSEVAGHQPNRQVNLAEASQDIFTRVRSKGMQCAVKGEFIEFDTVEELSDKLEDAVGSGYSIRVFDTVIGG